MIIAWFSPSNLRNRALSSEVHFELIRCLSTYSHLDRTIFSSENWKTERIYLG